MTCLRSAFADWKTKQSEREEKEKEFNEALGRLKEQERQIAELEEENRKEEEKESRRLSTIERLKAKEAAAKEDKTAEEEGRKSNSGSTASPRSSQSSPSFLPSAEHRARPTERGPSSSAAVSLVASTSRAASMLQMKTRTRYLEKSKERALQLKKMKEDETALKQLFETAKKALKRCPRFVPSFRNIEYIGLSQNHLKDREVSQSGLEHHHFSSFLVETISRLVCLFVYLSYRPSCMLLPILSNRDCAYSALFTLSLSLLSSYYFYCFCNFNLICLFVSYCALRSLIAAV